MAFPAPTTTSPFRLPPGAEMPAPAAPLPRRRWCGGWNRNEERAFAVRRVEERRMLDHWAAGGTLADFYPMVLTKRPLFKDVKR